MDHNMGAAYGYVWLNRIFVKRGSYFRLWKTSDIRLSRFEVVVMVVLALVFMGISVPIISFLMRWDAISNVINLWPFIFLNLGVAWMMGRRLAKASPYSRLTGENIFDWLVVTTDKRDTLLGKIVGHKVAVTEVTSWVSGKPQSVEAVEWIGSARAPRAPRRKADSMPTDLVSIALRPRVAPTNWVAETRRARRERFAELHPAPASAPAPIPVRTMPAQATVPVPVVEPAAPRAPQAPRFDAPLDRNDEDQRALSIDDLTGRRIPGREMGF